MTYVQAIRTGDGYVPTLTRDGQSQTVGHPQATKRDALTVAAGALMLERMAEAFERLLATR